ncbi:hypothetical protein [Streptomyces sp. NPDC000351]|uniref:hypothetical protein n=1 Tax=Streptomyces sp. NPDC000351 TaxID=3154250 RepID=UPI0033327D16
MWFNDPVRRGLVDTVVDLARQALPRPARAGTTVPTDVLDGHGLCSTRSRTSCLRTPEIDGLRISREFLTRIYDDDGTPTGVELSTTRPRQVVVIGSLREFTFIVEDR